MDLSIKDVFEAECAHLEIGPALVQKLTRYQIGFVNKDAEYIAFFGGNLLGVQVIRFTEDDRHQWFQDILATDEHGLEERLYSLPGVNPEFNVSSDVMNLSCAWLLNALHLSKKLTDTQKHTGQMAVLLVLQYKFLTSRLFRHFKYPADRAVAEATYAQLSKKFAIKQYGSWNAVLEARAEEILSDNSIHRRAIEKMDDDRGVVYLLNDSQSRIRDMLKNIYDVFLKVHKQGLRISTVSSVVEHDGIEVLKDQSKSLLAYGRYLRSVITDKNSFIRDELARVIERAMPTTPPVLFRETLSWMSDNYGQRGADAIETILTEALLHSFEYFSEDRAAVRDRTDLAGLIVRLKGVYGSSRSTDPVLVSLREVTERVVQTATGNKNKSILSSVRTAVLLYVVARALTMKHYTTAAAAVA